jgi:hypothetical protein
MLTAWQDSFNVSPQSRIQESESRIQNEKAATASADSLFFWILTPEFWIPFYFPLAYQSAIIFSDRDGVHKEFEMIPKYLIRALILVLLITSLTFAQTPTATPQTDEQRKAQKELEHKALNLLDDVIKDSDSFKHAENRIRIKIIAANILWKYDEARARTLFRETMASLIDLLNEPPSGDPTETRKMFEGPKELRGEMLQMLAKLDGRMARELLHATRSNAVKTSNVRGMNPDSDLQMDLNLAIQVASSDPKLASEIAEESLSKGMSYQLPNIITAIQAKDPDEAAKLASDLMTKLRAEKLDSNGEARRVAIGLLQIATAPPDDDAKNSLKNAPPLLDQATLRELTELLTKEALRSPAQNADLVSSLQSMMPVVEKYSPSQAAQLRRKAPPKVEEGDDIEDAGDFKKSDWEAYSQVLEKGSIDDLMAAAAKAPPGVNDALYQRAVLKLLEDGNQDRARQIVNEKIQDPAQRKQMLAQLDQAVAVAAAEQGKIEQARKMLATLHTDEERAMLLVQLATGAAAKDEKKIALQLLDEAHGMMSQRAKNIRQLGAQLLIARAYIRLEPSRSLEILEPIVDQLNDLLGAATTLGGFFIEELVRDDEIMLSPFSMLFNLASNDFTNQYVGDLAALARADFDRTRALVDRFQRDEIRILMRLLLAQSILSPSPSTVKGNANGNQAGGVLILGAPVGGVVIEKEDP